MNIDQLQVQFWLVALEATALGEPPKLPLELLDEVAWLSKFTVLLEMPTN